MALYEYYCEACKIKFEELSRHSNEHAGVCPKCKGTRTKKLISRFAVGGQGDLRESTLHGCHDHSLHPNEGHDPSHED